MTIGVITPIFDEEYLIPIFLEHYKFADQITFFYDTDTTDATLEKINTYKKTDVEIIEFNSGDGLDDYYMVDLLHEKLKNTSMDYSICVDADEFLFHNYKNKDTIGEDIRNEISRELKKFYSCSFFHMYPHHTEEKEISWEKPVWEQRRYGRFDNLYVKPCVIQKGSGLVYAPGKHFLFEDGNYTPLNTNTENYDFPGCHLNNVNLEFTLVRKLEKRKTRISAINKGRGAGEEYLFITEDSIRKEFMGVYPKLW